VRGIAPGEHRAVEQQAIAVLPAAHFLGGQVIQPQGGDLGDAQLAGGGEPPIAGDDLALPIGQDRIVETELPDAVRNLADLLLGVGTRVAVRGQKLIGSLVLDLKMMQNASRRRTRICQRR